MLTQLQELKNKKYGGNKQYIEINKEIAQLKEQTGLKRRDFSMKASGPQSIIWTQKGEKKKD